MAGDERPLLIFDGDCGFCTASANWLARGWSGEADLTSWQQLGPARLRDLGISAEKCRDAAFWVEATGGLYEGHRAIGKALSSCAGWRRVAGQVILHPAVTPFARVVYRAVARYRYRLPGATAACRTPLDGR